MLAQRVSSINAFAAVCEAVDARVDEVALSIGLDSRIGPKFLKASVGFGGSCFKKDILNLVYLSGALGLHEVAAYWKSVVDMNDYSMDRFCKRVIKTLFNTCKGKKICILGFAFKKDTGDTRESPAIMVASRMLEEGAYVQIHDPMVSSDQMMSDLKYVGVPAKTISDRVQTFPDAYLATHDADALLVLTEWEEFKHLDYRKIYHSMKKPACIFDGRLILNHEELVSIGFQVEVIGSTVCPPKKGPLRAFALEE